MWWGVHDIAYPQTSNEGASSPATPATICYKASSFPVQLTISIVDVFMLTTQDVYSYLFVFSDSYWQIRSAR